jgi:hypothetical protein
VRLYVRCATWFDANGRRCYAAIEDGALAIHTEGRKPVVIPAAAHREITRMCSNNASDYTHGNDTPKMYNTTSDVKTSTGETPGK